MSGKLPTLMDGMSYDGATENVGTENHEPKKIEEQKKMTDEIARMENV